jgi:hypothetical protein
METKVTGAGAMVSMCVPFYPWYRDYDRSEEIFDVLIPSLNAMDEKERIEISIVDAGVRDVWGKKRRHDVSRFYERLCEAWGGALVYTVTSLGITPRGHGAPGRIWISRLVDESVHQASSDWLFLTNIDIHHPKNLLLRYEEHVARGRIWAPVTYHIHRLMPRENDRGGWRNCGKGILGVHRADYRAVGGQDTGYVKDRHDADLWDRLRGRYAWSRGELPGLFHIDHPGCSEGTSEFKGTWTL